MPKFTALPTRIVTELREGATDAYGAAPELGISDGDGKPCRHCLCNIAKGEPYLTLAHRPFAGMNPYTETGPIFLHAKACERAAENGNVPEILTAPHYIVRGYSRDERIIYGSGGVVELDSLTHRATDLLTNPETAFVDIRSASNNCFLCRVLSDAP